MFRLSQFYISYFRPRFLGWLTKLIYQGKNIKIGRHFLTDSIPRIIVDEQARLTIGDNVEFRRSVEIRVHGAARVNIGNRCRIDRGVRILGANSANISISDSCRIGLYSVLNGGDSIEIGQEVLISGFVYIQTSMHGFRSKQVSIQKQGYEHESVIINRDVWIGTHAVIMPGCTLGEGSVVGSNAVVTKNVAPFSVVAGIPAHTLKERN